MTTTTSIATSATTPPTTTTTTTTTTVAPTTTLLEASRLLGTWILSSGTLLLVFLEEGRHEVSYLNRDPFDFGPYSLEGARLALTSAEESEVCGGLTGTYDVAVSPDGSELRFTFVSDSCFERANELARPAIRQDP